MLKYIIISIIVLLFGFSIGFSVLKINSNNKNSNSKNLKPKPPTKPPIKPKPQCDISHIKCGSKNCCNTKTESCIVESSECCDKTNICKDKSTTLDICCDEKNTACIHGECCTNICTAKNGDKTCCKTDEMCFNNECLNLNDATTCTIKNKTGNPIITDGCEKGITACVGPKCCKKDNICSFSDKDESVCCADDKACVTTTSGSKICCYKDKICSNSCCEKNETCINGFCCNNEHKCSDNTKCCYTGKDPSSTLKCLKDQDICCDKKNTYTTNFGKESCCDGTIYKDSSSTTKCCPSGSVVDGQKCKLTCGKEFCNTEFGEVCEDETHCVNTKCKWDPIIYSPQLVNNKYEACSVSGSDGLVSLYNNPQYVKSDDLHRTVEVQSTTPSECLEKYCKQRLDEKNLTFLDFDKDEKCSGSFDCSKLPDFNSTKSLEIENAIKTSYGNSVCMTPEGTFAGVLCEDKNQSCGLTENGYVCSEKWMYDSNGSKCGPSDHGIYNTIDECKKGLVEKVAEKAAAEKTAVCTFETNIDSRFCSVCSKPGYDFQSGLRTKCCPTITNCPIGWYGAGADKCDCGRCDKHIPNCNAYHPENCLCAKCEDTFELSPDNKTCCPKIGTGNWPNSGYCTKYNDSCGCDQCACAGSDCDAPGVNDLAPNPPWSSTLNKCCNSIKYCTSYDTTTCKCTSCISNGDLGTYNVDSTGTKCCIKNRWSGKQMCA
jgi:hypothetical protein